MAVHGGVAAAPQEAGHAQPLRHVLAHVPVGEVRLRPRRDPIPDRKHARSEQRHQTAAPDSFFAQRMMCVPTATVSPCWLTASMVATLRPPALSTSCTR